MNYGNRQFVPLQSDFLDYNMQTACECSRIAEVHPENVTIFIMFLESDTFLPYMRNRPEIQKIFRLNLIKFVLKFEKFFQLANHPVFFCLLIRRLSFTLDRPK